MRATDTSNKQEIEQRQQKKNIKISAKVQEKQKKRFESESNKEDSNRKDKNKESGNKQKQKWEKVKFLEYEKSGNDSNMRVYPEDNDYYGEVNEQK